MTRSDDDIIAEISQQLGGPYGLGHVDSNSVKRALWDWYRTTPKTPHNSVVWNEVDFLLNEGDFEPDLAERCYAALAAIRKKATL
jgi:hypothetical protein